MSTTVYLALRASPKSPARTALLCSTDLWCICSTHAASGPHQTPGKYRDTLVLRSCPQLNPPRCPWHARNVSAQAQGTEASHRPGTRHPSPELLRYGTHPDTVVRFHASVTCLHIHTPHPQRRLLSYLSQLKAKSRWIHPTPCQLRLLDHVSDCHTICSIVNLTLP
jgi:hypothetical protein